MSFVRLLAVRYLFSKTSLSATRWISIISAVAIGVVTAALVCVLSVYNGYTAMILASDNDSSTEYVIREVSQKNFDATPLLNQIQSSELSDKIHTGLVLSSQGVIEIAGEHIPLQIHGINQAYSELVPLKKHIYDGTYIEFHHITHTPDILLGIGLLQKNSLNINLTENPKLILPRRQGFINPLAPASAFEECSLRISGVLKPLSEDINKSAYIDIDVLQDMLSVPQGVVSTIALKPDRSISQTTLRRALSPILGTKYKLLNREEQQPERTFLIKSEKIMVYLIMTFILILAAFNLSSSLVMLIIEKRKNINTLISLGAQSNKIRWIFTLTGILTSTIGSIIGLSFGLTICLMQERFALLYTGEGTSQLPFPVDVQLSDLGLILIITLIVSSISAFLPSIFLRGRLKHS